MLRGAPWTTDCDLGDELAPHRLTAIARDAEGGELARAEQWLNLPRPRSEVTLLPEAAGGEAPRSVRVLWRSVDGARPDDVRITLDGRPVTGGDPHRIELPAYDPDRIHLLRAELRFGRSLAHAELVLGGEAGETIGSELTAFPVRLADDRKPPTAAQMAGWFHRAGRPLRVVAIDRGAGDLILVQDQSPRLLGRLDRLRQEVLGGPGPALSAKPGPVGIRHGDRLRVIVPYGLPAGGSAAGVAGAVRELFPISEDLARAAAPPASVGVGRRLVAGPRATGLLAATFYQAPPAGVPQRLADAVAEAGRAAAAGGRPRAVILVTGPGSPDASRFSPRQARAYLHRLQVPLRVWSPEAATGGWRWGDAVDRIPGRSQLRQAVRGVRALLDRQLVVWLEGRHLPQQIELGSAAAERLRSVVEPEPPSSAAAAAAGEIPADPPSAAPIAAATPADRPLPAPAGDQARAGRAAEPRAPAAFAQAVEVELVEVDAVVTDRAGRPVTDLGRQDFELRQDGELVEITHFRPPPAAAPDPGTAATDDRATAPPPTTPLDLMVVVDTRLPRAASSRVASALREVLGERRRPGRLMLVGLADTVTMHLEPGRDPAAAAAALAEIESRIGGRPSPAIDQERRIAAETTRVAAELAAARSIFDPLARQAALSSARARRDAMLVELRHGGESLRRELRATLDTLTRLTVSLAAIDGRKALLYIGDRLVTAPAGGLYAAVEAAAGELDLRADDLARLRAEASSLGAERDLAALARQANAYGVTLHALAPSVSGEQPGGVETASAGAPGTLSALRGGRSATLREAMCLMAQATGGLCQVEGTDLAHLIERAAGDPGIAYSLGYAPPRPADGELHAIEVKVRRPGLRVRHREGYLAKRPGGRLRDRLTAALLLGLESDALGMALELARVEPLAEPARSRLELEIRAPVSRLGVLPLEQPGMLGGRLRLLVALADDAGRATQVQEFPLTFRVAAERLGDDPVWGHRLRLTVETAARRVAVGLWDEIGRAGSFRAARIAQPAADSAPPES